MFKQTAYLVPAGHGGQNAAIGKERGENMDIKEFIDLKKLQDIQDQFSDATGLAAIAVDAKGNYITKGSNFTDFCMKYTRGSKIGQERCVKCDTECTGTYFCHAGLMDFASDIIIEGEKVGAIIGGQVLPGEPDIEKFEQVARELGVNEGEYIKALKKVPVRSERMIRAAARMLGDVVNQLVNLEYMKSLNQKKVSVLDEEIDGTISNINKVKIKLGELQAIASKENILSLNASIEAARVGAVGAGFAIVSKEMGDLARQSADAYMEINTLIGSIDKSIGKIKGADE